MSATKPKNALFGKYEFGRLLGCGAFAKVYHARNTDNGQSVAIKIINKNKIPSTKLMSNIKREISIMRMLHHPHIVNIYEVMATKTKIYIVLEFLKGGELFNKITKGRFSEDLSRLYFQQLISAVGFCHYRGVFHRDLKPENILVDEHGNIKVSDFGLSAVTGQFHNDGLLHTMCGTPAYVAPEILLRKGYDGARVDVWSCGVILFVLAAGYLPFNDPNLMALYRKIYKGEFRCPKSMSPDLKRLLSRILDTNPETRITIEGIVKDPWFKKGYKQIEFHREMKKHNEAVRVTNLNAFDIIGFSSGLNLSGLFGEFSIEGLNGDRFVGREVEAERVIEKVKDFAKGEKMKVVVMKELGVELVSVKGMVVAVDVYRLTEELVVVEGKRGGGDDEEYYREIWSDKLRPMLRGMMDDASL